MGLLRGTRRALLGKRGIKYLLRAWMGGTAAQDYADGQVLDTPAEGMLDGTLTVVEVDGTLSVNAQGECAFTAQATPAWGDQGVYSQAITRVLGRGFLTRRNFNMPGTSFLGWQNVANVGVANWEYPFYFTWAADVQVRPLGAGILVVGAYAVATDYQFAIILGGYDANGVPWRQGESPENYLYGATFLIQGGAYTTWTLLWRAALSNTTPLYAVFGNYNNAGTLSSFRVPDVDLSAVHQPQALNTMTSANGTLLPAITPEVGGVWTTRSGTFDIQANRANISVSTGARDVTTTEDGIADGLFDVVARKTAAVDSGEFGRVLRHTDADNYWMVNADLTNNQVELVERNAGVENVRASAAVALTHSTDYDVRAIAYGQTIDIFLDGDNKATYALAALNETVTRHGIVGNQVNQTFDNVASFPRTSPVYDSVLGAV